MEQTTRRGALKLAAAGATARLLIADAHKEHPTVTDTFPLQPPELIREVVTVAHFNLDRLRELVDERPSLARAAWDWGFGDWETALGAASHMGNRPIAEYLLSKGARPTLFSAAMLGQIGVVKAFVIAQPGVERIAGPHSISLLAHAHAGGELAQPVFDYLKSLGDAGGTAETPLSDGDRSSILGSYPFGPRENDRIEIAIDHGMLTWTRKGTTARPLHHLGDRVFYPAGAVDVRISFVESGGHITMTVSDPQPILTAARMPAA